MSSAPLADAARLLRRARKVVAFTGAGVSTESGIPDFRGPEGVWARYDPLEFSYERFVERAESRRAFWRFGAELRDLLDAAQPNAAHRALAELERRGQLTALITQNIDRLHQRAGSRAVIELHGNADEVVCLDCARVEPIAAVSARLLAGEDDPKCLRCGGVIKTRAVLFGEEMPERELEGAFRAVRGADLLLVVGSSLLVQPAAHLVPSARMAGARILLVNLEETPYDDLADVVLRGKAADLLPRLLD